MKAKVSAVTLTLMLLFSSIVGTLFVNPVRSNFWPAWFTWISQIRIESNGTISTFPDQPIIEQVGNVYYLTGNLTNYGITVLCDNIVLDGQGFTITSNGPERGYGLIIASHNVTARNFVIESVPGGIGLDGASGMIGESMKISIINNSISKCDFGIDCWWPSNNSISENVVESNNIGIQIRGGYYITGSSSSLGYSCFNVIDRNVITNNDEGIRIKNANYTTVSSNMITENKYGAILNYAQGSILVKNNITGNYIGACIEDANQTTVSLNIVTENQHGAYLQDAAGSVFVKNNITSNDIGVKLVPPSTGNQFCLNNFVDNSKNVVLQGESDLNNSWDDGASGNYWSGYSGEVYGIDENNVDHYPLTQQVDIFALPPTPTPLPALKVEAAVVVSIMIAVVVGAGLFIYYKKRKRTG